ncbi:MAG: L-2-hydroxyglutarate oxidase [Flavobacteriaceae bacterium]|nr:L-2-hydroxyglutarate oxidase [Flavobacteriaceae bacterium]
MLPKNYDFIIVGGGIVGLATAYKLQLKFPSKTVAVLEKENGIGKHQTGRNSGVMHSGIYYKPGSYKAKNCKNGHEQLSEFARKHHIKHDICGKIIVATTPKELPVLEGIYQRGIENGTEGIRYLDPDEIKEKEPFIEGIKAIWVPTAGIIDYVAVGQKLMEQVMTINPESRLITNCRYLAPCKEEHHANASINTTKGVFTAGTVIFCGGLQSDRIAKRSAVDPNMQIVGFRGDYYELTPEASHKINNLVYPVPDTNFPFLGVHFTRMIGGGVECGPNAVFSFKREGYTTTSFNFRDTFQALLYKGTWKLFFKHWRKGLDEYRRAFSKRLFVKALRKMMPTLRMDDVQPCRAGVRAQAVDSNGGMIDDFKIVQEHHMIHVLNAPSPAATACLAIADEIVALVKADS